MLSIENVHVVVCPRPCNTDKTPAVAATTRANDLRHCTRDLHLAASSRVLISGGPAAAAAVVGGGAPMSTSPSFSPIFFRNICAVIREFAEGCLFQTFFRNSCAGLIGDFGLDWVISFRSTCVKLSW